MNVNEDTLTEAIKTYAVLHNRTFWFDPDRVDFQVDVWHRLIDLHAEQGLVVGDDFLSAEDRLLRPPAPEQEWKHTLALRDISPKHIIDMACTLAAKRRERAEHAVKHPTRVLYTERIAWHNVRDGVQNPDGLYEDIGELIPEMREQVIAERVARADKVFVGHVEALIYDLLNSGLPDSQTTPVIADLRARLAGSGLTASNGQAALG